MKFCLQLERSYAVLFFQETETVCTDMKRITLDKIIEVMKHGGNEVCMDNGQADEAAKQTLTRMLELAK